MLVTACGCVSLSPAPLHTALKPAACLPLSLTDGRGLKDGKVLHVS